MSFVTCPKSSNIVKINSFADNHNHTLTSSIQEITPRFQKLITEMLFDIEKYVIQGRMDSDLFIHYLNMIVLTILSIKRIYIMRYINFGQPHLEPTSRKLNHLLWMPPSQ
ncbi:hypothetical protein GLOIN_2v1770853 [Rhizophagus irregularis DAOM 181602=DAOM 197198]|uniref:FAR1 domain-containing protein n=1 Tax=Rhizophagus irregularis (strain DAOM 181602 / DAOM 197198 / MUCL 43194) TaxID=747089 RepID=U9TXC2_RHIID|nr:hypothetical protein GLOIN_2v1770853 [Rhizophagus irregularis DAOM 181602=DAOM 197198]